LTKLATHYDLKVSAYTLAIWTSVNIFGLVLADIEPDPLDPQGFVSVINDTWLSMMRLHPRVNVPELTEPLQASEITEEPLPSTLPAMVPSSPRNETSEAIIAAATLLLRREGVAGTSTVRVAQVADVSDATVGYYFRSREQLFIEVFERAAAERLALLAVLLAKMPHDANAAAELLIAWHLADATDPDRAGIWRQLRALAAAEAALAARIEEHDHAFADLVLEGLGVAPTPAGFDVQGVGEGTSGAVSATGQTLRALVLRLQVLVLGLQVMAPTMGRRAVDLDALHGWVRSDLIAALAEAIREATSP
jgi:AcrR family transcriptional regulator